MKCQITGLARSTYYYKGNNKEEDDLRWKRKIEKIIVRQEGYGYRRVTRQLKRDGENINHKKVQRIMRKYSLSCRKKAKFRITTTDSKHNFKVYPNLAGDFQPQTIDQLWVADITYIRLNEGFVYLAVILDSYSRKVIGYAMSRKIDAELALSALKMALEKRNPAEGCIHHSDRGVQYACTRYTQLLNSRKLQISMSRKGNPYDNAKAESFMKTLKTESVYLSEYDNFYDATRQVFRFIRDVYNSRRLHSSIGYLPPDELEKKLVKKGLEKVSDILARKVDMKKFSTFPQLSTKKEKK